MNKIFKFSEFIFEAVSIPQILKDFVEFLEEQPVITLYPKDKDGDEVRQGWICEEHKMYSMPAIDKYFRKKYGKDFHDLNLVNAIHYDPNIKKLKKLLSEKDMNLQTTPVKGMYGETSWFFSSNLTDDEISSIKSKYEAEFAKRYSKYFDRRKAAIKKAPTTSRGRKAKKNEALEFLIEGLFKIGFK